MNPYDSHALKSANKETIAVIGAGVVGLCTALEAQRKGYQVSLIDHNLPGKGASFGNAGYLATELISPLSTRKTLYSALPMLLSPHGPLSLPLEYIHKSIPWLSRFIIAAKPNSVKTAQLALNELNSNAVEAWKRCLNDIGASEQLIKSGYLLVWESKNKINEAIKHAAYMHKWGITCRLVKDKELRDLEPELSSNISHALFFPDAYHVKDPFILCQKLSQIFQKRGGKLIVDKVNKLIPDQNTVKIELEKGKHQFNYSIVCTGAWSKKLLADVNLDVPLEAERGYHLSIKASKLKIRHPIGSVERRFVISPLTSGLRVVGITEFGGLILPPFRKHFASLTHHSNNLIPRLEKQTIDTQEWMGHRPTLPDSLPIISKHPMHPQLLFCFGHQHLGLTQAAISAEYIIGLLDRTLEPDRCFAFRVDRF